MNVFGIDVGGSAIKGALVDTHTGKLLAERVRIKTPKPSTPEALVTTAVEVVRRSGWEGPVGCGFPDRTRIERAEMHNDAGIAGAALAGIPATSAVQAAE